VQSSIKRLARQQARPARARQQEKQAIMSAAARSTPRTQSRCRLAWALASDGGAETLTQWKAPRRGSAISARTTARRADARSAGAGASARTSARGASARSAGARASARTSASGANARSAGARASARTSASGASARSAGARASARTSASGAAAKNAAQRRMSQCRTG